MTTKLLVKELEKILSHAKDHGLPMQTLEKHLGSLRKKQKRVSNFWTSQDEFELLEKAAHQMEKKTGIDISVPMYCKIKSIAAAKEDLKK